MDYFKAVNKKKEAGTKKETTAKDTERAKVYYYLVIISNPLEVVEAERAYNSAKQLSDEAASDYVKAENEAKQSYDKKNDAQDAQEAALSAYQDAQTAADAANDALQQCESNNVIC